MILVVDANALFSFFKSSSDVRTIVLDPSLKFNLELIAPKLLLLELDKHKGDVCRKAKISEKEYEFPRNVLEVFIKTFSDESWREFREEASKLIIGHPKDAPYFALALKLKCPIWSNERRFKKQFKVKVYNTSELLKELGLIE